VADPGNYQSPTDYYEALLRGVVYPNNDEWSGKARKEASRGRSAVVELWKVRPSRKKRAID